MNLQNLGFNHWFEKHTTSARPDEFRLARVISVHKESYTVTDGARETYAEITGKLMFSAESPLDYPTVGDWCYVQFLDDNSLAIIHEILPRRSILKRKAAGKKIEFQLIAANIDTALIIQALDADFSPRRLERYLAMVKNGGIEPVFMLSKKDLLPEAELREKTEEIRAMIPDVRIVAFSNTESFGLDEIKELLSPSHTFCLLGSSGVGKTTLLNGLLGAEVFDTKAIREKDGKGKHTTTGRQLIVLESGAMIIDTPGMRELGNIGVESGIGEVFDEIVEMESQCKYNDCSHTQENGCAVLEALETGSLSNERYQNYAKIKKESAYNERSYLEKRKRDKKFGKLYKSVQKHNVKK